MFHCPPRIPWRIWNQDGARMCFQNDGRKWKNAQKYDSDLVELAGWTPWVNESQWHMEDVALIIQRANLDSSHATSNVQYPWTKRPSRYHSVYPKKATTTYKYQISCDLCLMANASISVPLCLRKTSTCHSKPKPKNIVPPCQLSQLVSKPSNIYPVFTWNTVHSTASFLSGQTLHCDNWWARYSHSEWKYWSCA